MNKEDEKVFDEVMEMAWHGYYKAELLRGYCEYAEDDEQFSIGMISAIMSELKDLQKKIIDKIDDYTTMQYVV